MDDAFAFCEQRVRQADRDRYLATLFAPALQRPQLHALYAFDIEIASLGDRLREPLAGELRLQWWREVIQGGRAEEAQGNPLARALSEVLAAGIFPAETLLAFLDARSADLYPEPTATMAEFEAHAHDTLGVILALAARVLGATDAAARGDAVRHASLALAHAEAVRRLPADAARGRLSLPVELLRGCGADGQDILAGRATPALATALGEAHARALQEFERARNAILELPAPARVAFLHLSLVPSLLRHAARHHTDPFRAPSEPAAWRRQWTLWWASRRWLRQ